MSWLIALVEYSIAVPANRLGAASGLNVAQLKIIQEVVFASFGNPEGPCGNFTVGTCHTPNAKQVVEKVRTH